ncbi:TetR/AcrR family transcriptional regulator [Brevibacillus ginsengisoli]|uniref:TetR/AcrR family transcriptional regulator n=1 Tax=Brevibacillus ginsengisoli TaxID=363854 RepID=UPI003CEDDE8C
MDQNKQHHTEGKAEEQETRKKILAAARHLMAQKGFKGATTRLIAEEAGVNEVTIFRHFGNKEGLITALLEEVSTIQPQLEVLNPLDYPTVRDFLISYTEVFNQALQERKEILMITFIEAKNLMDETHCIFYKLPSAAIFVLIDKLALLHQAGKIVDCDLAVAAHMLISSFYSAFFVRIQAGIENFAIDEKRLLDRSVDILIRALQVS